METDSVGSRPWPELCLGPISDEEDDGDTRTVNEEKKKAKKYCIVFGCLNNDKDPNLTFFALPRDSERRRKWLTLIDRDDLLRKEDLKWKNYVVCCAHFEDKYVSKNMKKKLKNNAEPTINLLNSEAQSTSAQIKGKLVITSNKNKGKAYVTVATQTLKGRTKALKSLSKESPKILNLSKELREYKLKCRRLEREIKKIEKELEAKNESTSSDADDEIGRRFRKLMEWQNKIKNKSKGNRYDAEYKVFALNLHYSSPHAYRFLKTMLKLPCKKTLHRFKIDISPKFDSRVLDSLALKVKSLPDEAKHCTICVDEMTMKRNLFYNIKTDEIVGFHNVDGKITPEIASHAFVVMLQGIYFDWNQPISYALLANEKHYEEVDLWMNEIISKLTAIGIKVKAIVSNHGSDFEKFAKEEKEVSIEKPYFVYDNTKIYYIFDVPGLIKCIRNDLLTSDFFHRGKRISWDYIEQLYKDQKGRNLRLLPKITDAHIQPKTIQKMKVKLAVQTLSRAVSAALHTYIDLGKISEEARPTADFIESMNNLFDVLNSSKIKCYNKFQTAFTLSTEQENVLNDAKKMFSATTALNRKTGEDNTRYTKSFINFQISIQSVKMLYEDLKEDGFKYLLTRRLNQDNLENFFNAIKQYGSSNEITPIQFETAFSKLFLSNMIKIPTHANCEMDIGDILIKAEDMMKSTLFGSKSQPAPQTSAVSLRGETDYRMDLPDENALVYVSGYLFFKCVNVHKCSELNNVVNSVPGLSENSFPTYEAYNEQFGLLETPKEFIEYVQNLEMAFTQNCAKLIQNNPGGEFLKLFKSVPPQTPCSCFPVNYLLKLFIRFRIFNTIKFNNLQFRDGENGIMEYVQVNHL